MEHRPDTQPMDRRKWVGFDEFEVAIDEALEDNERIMKRPGEIGGVACQPSFDFDLLPDPPEAA